MYSTLLAKSQDFSFSKKSRIYSFRKSSIFFLFQAMFKLLVILFIVKLNRHLIIYSIINASCFLGFGFIFLTNILNLKQFYPVKMIDWFSGINTSDIKEGWTFSTTFKGAPEGLRQFLITETPLKMMKNAFYFTLFLLKIFKFLSRLFGHVEKRLD